MHIQLGHLHNIIFFIYFLSRTCSAGRV